jgi:hypothetical protein
MSIKEAKEKIISNINELQDERIIRQVYVMLGIDLEEIDEKPVVLSDAEIEAIEKGLEDIKNGRFISLEESNKEVDKWLNGK